MKYKIKYRNYMTVNFEIYFYCQVIDSRLCHESIIYVTFSSQLHIVWSESVQDLIQKKKKL